MDEKLIALFKLVSGEEVLSEYKLDEEFYILKAPRRVFVAQMPGNQGMGVKMMPWIVGNPDGAFPVGSHHVLTVSADVEEQLKAGYLQQTSPIDLSQSAPAKLIV